MNSEEESLTPGDGYWYMAGPYTDNPTKRYNDHMKSLYLLTQHGLTIYSPIVHFHQLAADYELPKDAAFWEQHNFNMIKSAKGVIIVRMPDWEKSQGVAQEVIFSRIHDIQIWYMNWLLMKFSRRPDVY
jgi:hypothetical protein